MMSRNPLKYKFSNNLLSLALLSTFLLTHFVTGCFGGVSNETKKLDAILSGDWHELQELTSDIGYISNPIDRFLNHHSCKETNSSYYDEIILPNPDEDYDETLKVYDWISYHYERNPKNANLAYLTARAGYLSIELTHEESLKLLDLAIAINPSFVTAYIERTKLNLMLRNEEAAIRDFEVALRLGDSLCYLHIMKSQFEMSDDSLAIVYLEPCLKINGRHAYGLSMLANLLGRLNRFEEAARALELAVEQEPWSMLLKTELAGFYQTLDQSEQATRLYHEIVDSKASRYATLRENASRQIEFIDSDSK